MAGHGPGNAAVFAQGHHPAPGPDPERVEIVVQGIHISPALIVPAAGLVHKAGTVQPADGLHGPGGIELPPALIEGHPAAHAGVALQGLYRGFQLPGIFFPARFRFAAQQAPEGPCIRQAAEQRLEHVGQVGHEPELVGPAAVHHVLPDDEAQLIAVVIPALRLDLGVLAQKVEAQLFYGLQFPYHCPIAGRGVQALGPVALIQQAVEQDGLAIQAEAHDPVGIRHTAPLAQGKVAVDGVALLFLSLRGAHDQVVQKRRIRAPREEMLLRDVQGHLAVPVGLVAAPVLGNGHAPGPHHGPQVRRPAGQGSMGFHGHGAGIIVRGDGQLRDVVFRHTLQPDGLPDAALGRVEHPAGPEGLLAPGLHAGAGGVLHRHPEPVMAGRVQRIGDIQRKGPVAAPVAPHQMAVDLHGAGIVHGPEVEQHPPAGACRGHKAPVVVEPRPGLQGASHAGGFRLRGVGHQNVAVPLCGQPGRAGDGVLPQAVQVLVTVPPQGRAGIFGQRMMLHTVTAFSAPIVAQANRLV